MRAHHQKERKKQRKKETKKQSQIEKQKESQKNNVIIYQLIFHVPTVLHPLSSPKGSARILTPAEETEKDFAVDPVPVVK